jgi:hypothetical protein
MKIFKIRQWKDVNLLMQNMKPRIFHDEGKNIPKNIMGCSLLPTMGAMKNASSP